MSTYISKDGEQVGPYDDATIRQGLADGAFSYEEHAWREGMADWVPLRELYSRPSAMPPARPPLRAPAPPPSALATGLRCQTCGQGSMVKKKSYRMSTPVVLIGYILLIPSIIGILFSLFVLMGSVGASSQVSTVGDLSARQKMEQSAIPEDVIARAMKMEPIPVKDLASLSPEQKNALANARGSLAGGKLGAGVGVAAGIGLSLFFLVAFFVGGLLGWLLVMKKRVLQCNSCSAVVAAS